MFCVSHMQINQIRWFVQLEEKQKTKTLSPTVHQETQDFVPLHSYKQKPRDAKYCVSI